MTKQFYVYTHAKPDGSIFYVGKGLKARVNKIQRPHNSYHTRIVEKYGVENIIIESKLCESERHALDLEVFIIRMYRRMGVKLTNATDGGEGTSGRVASVEQRLKMSASIRLFFKNNPESLIKAGLARRGQKHTPEARAKMSHAWETRPPITDEPRAKISASNMGRKPTPEQIARISATNKLTKSTPAARARHSAAQMGHIVTPEARAKMSVARKGKKASPETRAKMSLAQKGKVMPPEAIAKIAAANKGRKATPEARKNMSIAQLKRPPTTDQTRARISAASKNQSPESRAKAALANKGRKHTQEAIARMSVAQLNRPPITEEARKNMSAAQKGKKLTPEHRAKISAGGIGRIVSLEGRENMSVAAKKRCAAKSTQTIGQTYEIF